MITTGENIVGYEIVSMLGVIEAFAEKGFKSMAVAGVGIVGGGELESLLFDAKDRLARSAFEVGANAVIGCSLRFLSVGS